MASKNVEEIKEESQLLRGTIADTLKSDATHFSEEELQLLKFHGSYQQDDRDQRTSRKQANLDKAWSFMVRSKLPGGALTAKQYLEHDQVAQQLGNGTLRITTRQGFQFHGVLKGDLKDCVKQINEAGLTTWGACGDVVRNTIAPSTPLKDVAHEDAQRLAKEISKAFLARSSAYAEIWLDGEKVAASESESEPIYGEHYLPRKFKIGIAIPPRNDTDIYSNDLGFIPHVTEGKVQGYTIVVGGGFGMTHGKTDTYPVLAKPLGYVQRPYVIDAAIAVVTTQRDFGNRENRKRARLKYLIEERGIDWFRDEVSARFKHPIESPKPVAWETVSDLLGWHSQQDGKLFVGIWVEEGRISDATAKKYRTAFFEIADRFGVPVRLTANCNLFFHDIDPASKTEIDRILSERGIPKPEDLSAARRVAHACVALPTCGLALAESERVFPAILKEIDVLLDEFGLREEPILIRMTGCPNGCARPYNADISFVGRAPGKYALYVGGSITGERLVGLYEKSVLRGEIAMKIRPILEEFAMNRRDGETFSSYWGRAHQNGPAPHPEQFHTELAARSELQMTEA